MTSQASAPVEGSHESVEEFRQRARAWLESLDSEPVDELPPEEQLAKSRVFQRALHEAGFAGITWPVEYGGQGLSTAHQQAFDEEATRFELPTHAFMITMGMCAPTLVDLGTHEQKKRYLPKLLAGEELWCQLFSEPDAGSDIAGLRTRAVLEGDEWVINGQKVWTSRAHWAELGALLARTDPDQPKHQGITMFIVDMKHPGVTVRPLRVMTGESPFNEVYFDNVRIPKDAVIGQVNEGWKAAVTMLGHERVSLGARRPAKNNSLSYDALARLAHRLGVAQDPGTRRKLAEFYAQEQALALLVSRFRQETEVGRPPGPRGSITKLTGSTQQKRAVALLGEIAGPSLTAWDADDEFGTELAFRINMSPAPGIAGGTSEVQHNIIGERVLGLPKEPQMDKGVPYRDVAVGNQRKENQS